MIKESSEPLPPQEPGPQSGITSERLVLLPDGALYRGIVLEYEPGDHVALRMHDGTIKRFTWREIKQAMAPVTQTDPTVAIPIAPERQIALKSGAKKRGLVLEYVPDEAVPPESRARSAVPGQAPRSRCA